MMTDIEFEERIRRLEDWRIEHNEKCSGRGASYLTAIEATTKSIDTLSTLVGKNRTDIDRIDKKIAYWSGIAAAAGGLAGSGISSLFGG